MSKQKIGIYSRGFFSRKYIALMMVNLLAMFAVNLYNFLDLFQDRRYLNEQTHSVIKYATDLFNIYAIWAVFAIIPIVLYSSILKEEEIYFVIRLGRSKMYKLNMRFTLKFAIINSILNTLIGTTCIFIFSGIVSIMYIIYSILFNIFIFLFFIEIYRVFSSIFKNRVVPYIFVIVVALIIDNFPVVAIFLRAMNIQYDENLVTKFIIMAFIIIMEFIDEKIYINRDMLEV